VCQLCHSGVDPSYALCYQCNSARRLDPPEIVPITLAVERELVHDHLRGYKDDQSEAAREQKVNRLAALTALWLKGHADCLGPFDSVVTVPSPARDAAHEIVTRVRRLRKAHAPTLEAAERVAPRVPDPARFTITRDVAGERVLIFDDTFTSGASVFSAAAALRSAGAVVADVLCVGRYVRRSFPPSAAMLAWLEERPWQDARCVRCDGERRDPAALFDW
jgi:predicted amidophosphoribosyltransferase